ncbi:hypothetical protein EGH22_01205 [Halomicroarcula sp. F28]|uniref:hypothetical protein n=1 Tax=Haloarcula salinisoli TaxID=2487746 RepID=UPI001C730888|nr:hypothetical protein [Halomicroarcula salinisoli]MBX0284931.1 hypothetical protein [Halomicroarcula salinisoli]
MSRYGTRRRFLTAAAAAFAGLGLATTTDADDHRTFTVEQDGDCYPVVPLSGDEPVEAFYEWGLDERSYSSEGTRELQDSETSLLFLYRGPEGLSLVVVHDAADDGTPGGKVTFEITGIPGSATWAVKDDLYEAETNVDTWEVNGTVLEANESTITDDYNASSENETAGDGNETEPYQNETEDTAIDQGKNDTAGDGNETEPDQNETAASTRTDEIDWWWTTGRTDGGALRGLAVDDLELRIEPAFNDEAELEDTPNDGEVTSWELLSGDREDPDRTALDLDEPLTLRTGSCDGDTPTADDATEANATDNSTGTENESETTDASEDEEDIAADNEDEADSDESE